MNAAPQPSRERCVHFRFRLKGGYDFQAVATDASVTNASFEKHYEEPLSIVESGYFETGDRMFTISGVSKPAPSRHKPNLLVIDYTSAPLGVPTLGAQEMDFVLQRRGALQKRHAQLQAMNESSAKSVIKLYTLMLLYAAAPFSRLHGFLETGFFRVWGLGGTWLAVTDGFTVIACFGNTATTSLNKSSA